MMQLSIELKYMEVGWQRKQPRESGERNDRRKKVRGEPLPDWDADPDREVESESSICVILKTKSIILVVVTLSGWFMTGGMMWGYTGK
jgi:hypothetical protein